MIVRSREALTEPGLQAGPTQERWQVRGVSETPSPAIVRYPSRMLCRSLLPALLGLAACVPATSGTRTTSSERARPAREVVAAPWVVRNQGIHRTQEVTIRATLTSSVDTKVRMDTVESVMTVSWSRVPNAEPERLAGMVTDFGVRIGSDSLHRTPDAVALPFSFVAIRNIDGAQPEIMIPDTAECANANAAAMQVWREVWMDLPASLRVGARWADSGKYTICRDGIPLRVTAHRHFETVGMEVRDGHAVVLVSRRSQVTLEGEGFQLGEPISITGSGSGIAALEIALDGGVIVTGEGKAELDLELRGRRRTQHVRQDTRMEIRAP